MQDILYIKKSDLRTKNIVIPLCGINFETEPDSTLYYKDRKEYSYLFREAQTLRNWNQDEGFVVKGSEQQLEPFTRHGYTVIEWDGAEI